MNLSIKKKLYSIIGILGLFIVLMFLATLQFINKQADDAIVINLAGRQRMLSQKMSKEILNLRKNVICDNADDGNKLSEVILNSVKVFDMTLNSLEKSGKAPETLDLSTTKFANLPKAKEPTLGQLIKVEKIWKPFAESIKLFLEDPGSDQQLDYILKNNMILLSEMNKAVVMLQKQSEAGITSLMVKLIILIIIGIILVAVAFFIINSIITRLKKIENYSIEYGNGNFSIDTNISGNDELSHVGFALQEMEEKLGTSFRNIIEISETLFHSSESLQNISTQMSETSDEVVQKSNTVASAAEEMSSNMNVIADTTKNSTDNLNTVAVGTEEMSSSINEIAQNVVTSTKITQNAVKQVVEASAQIKELGFAAKEIVKVTDTITDISNQTNLLALNATIEAARAGDAGKGFAVVANEIKELAKQTANATEEIASKLSGVQKSSENTTEQITGITKIINEIDSIVGTIASAVEEQNATTQENAGKINEVSKNFAEINENVSQGSEATAQIAEEIVEVNEASNEMSNSASQVQQNSEDLQRMVGNLKEIIGQFKV